MVKQTKKSAVSKSGLENIRHSVSDAAAAFAEDIDKAKETAVREIREGFDAVSKKAKKAGQMAAEATESVKDSFSEAHPAELIRELADDVETVAEGLIEGISAKFNQLREAVVTPPPKKKQARKAAGKKAAVKKAAVKKAAVKKAAVKKAAVKKAALKKTAVKKTAVKKTALKKTALKKTALKKTAVKKTAVKKTAVKKTAVKKTSPKKKAASAKAAPGKRAAVKNILPKSATRKK